MLKIPENNSVLASSEFYIYKTEFPRFSLILVCGHRSRRHLINNIDNIVNINNINVNESLMLLMTMSY